MIFKRKTSAAKAKEIVETYKRLPRPLGSRVGVIRFRCKDNHDAFEVGTIVGDRFDQRRNFFVYAVEFDDGVVEAIAEPELFSSYAIQEDRIRKLERQDG